MELIICVQHNKAFWDILQRKHSGYGDIADISVNCLLKQSANSSSKDTSGPGRIRTHSPTQKSKGKTDKHILTKNKITDDKSN